MLAASLFARPPRGSAEICLNVSKAVLSATQSGILPVWSVHGSPHDGQHPFEGLVSSCFALIRASKSDLIRAFTAGGKSVRSGLQPGQSRQLSPSSQSLLCLVFITRKAQFVFDRDGLCRNSRRWGREAQSPHESIHKNYRPKPSEHGNLARSFSEIPEARPSFLLMGDLPQDKSEGSL